MEAFPGRLLSEILSEVQRLPVGLLDQVLEAKAYRHTKALVDAASTSEAKKRLPNTWLFALVDEIEGALAQEAIDRKSLGHG